MKRYLVTGGAGFIGSNLVKRLVEERCEVIVIDNLSTGSKENLPKEVPLLIGTYKEHLSLLPHIDGIFHLGIPSSTPLYRESRLWILEALQDSIYILEFARGRGLRAVFASSSSIYNGNPVPWSEDMPIFITDFYSEVRYWMERLSTLYFDFYKVESIGLRLFSVYGRGEEAKGKFANLVTQLIWASKDGSIFSVYGNGSQSRDLTYIDDVVNAFIISMNSPIKHGVFNIGTGRAFSLNEIISTIGAKVEYIKNPLRNYINQTLADTRKARQELGFESKYSLEEGLGILRGRDW